MRTLYVGDVHGCSLELSRLLDAAGADRVVMLGDLFTKGPDPLGVWSLLGEVGAESLLGNHDHFVLRRWEDRDPPPAVARLRRRAPEVRPWLKALPLFRREGEILAVHAGLNPLLGEPGTTPAQALTLRRWPDDADPGNPFWYDAGWAGPEIAVFGHDAARGLVRRELGGRPVALGLDTGCVYGGALTGWIAEEDRLIQVPAAEAYSPIQGGY